MVGVGGWGITNMIALFERLPPPLKKNLPIYHVSENSTYLSKSIGLAQEKEMCLLLKIQHNDINICSLFKEYY